MIRICVPYTNTWHLTLSLSALTNSDDDTRQHNLHKFTMRCSKCSCPACFKSQAKTSQHVRCESTGNQLHVHAQISETRDKTNRRAHQVPKSVSSLQFCSTVTFNLDMSLEQNRGTDQIVLHCEKNMTDNREKEK